MRILFVAPTPPVPTSGGRTRFYNLVKQLAARHAISVLSFVQPDERDLLDAVKPYCQVIETVPFGAFAPLGKWENRLRGWQQILFSNRPRYATVFPVDQLRAPLRTMLASDHFDVVVLQGLYVAELVDELATVPVVLATENIESEIIRHQLAHAVNPVHRVRDELLWKKLRDYENRMLRRFPVCVAVSELDVERMRVIAPQTEVHLVANGVDTQAFQPPAISREADTMLFFGTLNYEPNADGIIWFSREILPQVRSAVADTRLRIVGKDPPDRVQRLADLPGVELVGFVPDVRHELWSAALSIAPLRSGGGTRLKILESLAARCPVVSTSIGAEGLPLVDGESLIIADTAEAFAVGITRLLRDPAFGARLGDNGQAVIAQRYDWQPIAGQLEQACARAIQLYGAGTRAAAAD